MKVGFQETEEIENRKPKLKKKKKNWKQHSRANYYNYARDASLVKPLPQQHFSRTKKKKRQVYSQGGQDKFTALTSGSQRFNC